MRKLLNLLLIVASVLCASTVLAQPTNTPKKIRDELPSEDLKKGWDRGVVLYKDGNFTGALVEFEAVYDKTKNPRVLYNIAVCQRKLDQYTKAISALEKQLAFRDELPKDEVARAEELIELIRRYVTTLDLKVDQEGASVTLNGVDVGQTPFTAPLPINVGKNVIVVEKPSFKTLTRELVVAKDEPAELSLTLEPELRTAMVTISVAGAERATIVMDGRELGPAPYQGPVPVGPHTFEARADGFVTARQTSEVLYGQPLRVTLKLVEETTQGKVRIVTDHDDALIMVDGKMMGTGAWEGVLSSGGHELVITKDGYRDYKQELALEDDQERTVRVTLQEDPTGAYIFWSVSSVVVAAGISVGAYFVFRPTETAVVDGTFNPGTVPTLFRF